MAVLKQNGWRVSIGMGGGIGLEYALEEVAKSMRNGAKPITEREAAVIADGLLRKTAVNLQKADIPGAFAGYAPNYQADEDSIYNAFRRGKRAMGLTRSRQTKK